MPDVYTLPQIARKYGVQAWQVGRLFERGLLPEPDRVGQWRVVTFGDLDKVEAALIKAGYLKRTKTALAT